MKWIPVFFCKGVTKEHSVDKDFPWGDLAGEPTRVALGIAGNTRECLPAAVIGTTSLCLCSELCLLLLPFFVLLCCSGKSSVVEAWSGAGTPYSELRHSLDGLPLSPSPVSFWIASVHRPGCRQPRGQTLLAAGTKCTLFLVRLCQPLFLPVWMPHSPLTPCMISTCCPLLLSNYLGSALPHSALGLRSAWDCQPLFCVLWAW